MSQQKLRNYSQDLLSAFGGGGLEFQFRKVKPNESTRRNDR
jgi:hypothetical protein